MESKFGCVLEMILMMHVILLPKLYAQWASSVILVETRLPLIYGMEKVAEINASSPLLCSMQCVKSGCIGFIFVTEDFVDDNSCYSSPKPSGYNGTVSVAMDGNACQNWADQTPHKHSLTGKDFLEGSLADVKNYCRAPKQSGANWCYTVNPNVERKLCDVYPCLNGIGNCRLFSVRENEFIPYREHPGYRYFHSISYTSN